MFLCKFLKSIFHKLKVEDNDWTLRIKKERNDLRSMAVSYNVCIEDFV